MEIEVPVATKPPPPRSSEENLKQKEPNEPLVTPSNPTPDSSQQNVSTSPEPVKKPRRGSRLKGFSIADLDEKTKTEEGNAESEELQDLTGLPQEIFSEHELKLVWKAYLEKIEHKKSIYNTLSKQQPKLLDKATILLQLDNKTQEGYLHSGRAELMAYLRSGLKNYKIDLEVEVAEKEEVNLLYTPDEKYKHMVEKNPVLAEFKKKLDLDLE